MKRLLISILGEKDANSVLGLSLRHKLYVLYFCISFCMLFIGDESTLPVIALVVANFANACRLIKKVPLELDEA